MTENPPETAGDPDVAAEAADKRTSLPEERAAGVDDPAGQAEAVLDESVDRTEDVDPDMGHQTRRRSSEETLDPPA